MAYVIFLYILLILVLIIGFYFFFRMKNRESKNKRTYYGQYPDLSQLYLFQTKSEKELTPFYNRQPRGYINRGLSPLSSNSNNSPPITISIRNNPSRHIPPNPDEKNDMYSDGGETAGNPQKGYTTIFGNESAEERKKRLQRHGIGSTKDNVAIEDSDNFNYYAKNAGACTIS